MGGPVYLPSKTTVFLCPSERPYDFLWWNYIYGVASTVYTEMILTRADGTVQRTLTGGGNGSDPRAQGVNINYRYMPNAAEYRRLSKVRPASRWPAFVDSYYQPGGIDQKQYWYVPNPNILTQSGAGPAMRHGGRMNAAMFDGSVQTLDKGEVGNAGWKTAWLKQSGTYKVVNVR